MLADSTQMGTFALIPIIHQHQGDEEQVWD